MNNKESVLSSTLNVEVENNKYSIFHLYKWATILYEMALVLEFIIVPIFWIVIFPGLLKNRHDGVDLPDIDDMRDDEKFSYAVVAGVLDHTVPLVVLLIEFSYNCIPFLWRHFLLTLAVVVIYAVFNIIYTLSVHQIYPMIDFTQATDYLITLATIVWTVAMYYLAVKLSQRKLKNSEKNLALV